MPVIPFKGDADFDQHNSKATATSGADIQQFLSDHEALQREIDDSRVDQKDLVTVMKSKGYNIKALREILKRRKQDAGERQELEETVQLYMDLLRG